MKSFCILSTLAAFLTCPAQAGQTVQYFPHFAFGGGAESDFTVHNPGDQPIAVSLELFRSDGSALAARQVDVPAGGTVTEFFSDPPGDLTTGWARLSSDQEFTSTLFAHISGSANVGVGPVSRATRLMVFNFAEKGARTGFAVVNPSESLQSDLTFRGFGVDGSQLVSGGFTLQPGQHRAFFLDEAPTSAGSDGTIDLQASSPVIAVAIRVQNTLTSGVPVAVPDMVRVEFNDVSPNVIGGHDGNQAAAGVVGAVIAGGGVDGSARNLSSTSSFGCPKCFNRVIDNYGTVGGGLANLAAFTASVGGGLDNVARGESATVGGGHDNTANATWATVGGGFENTANNDSATVGGGIANTASGIDATVGGGRDNAASGLGATVPGGVANSAGGDFSFAAGRRAQANLTGAMTFADFSNADFAASRPNSFNVRASRGVYFYSNSSLSSGVELLPGASSWSMVSDRANKENVAQVDSRELLQRLAALPVSTWNYKSQDERIRHMGPMAQDFHAAFGLGEDERRISSVDADGVALAAIQGLYRLLEEKQAELESQRNQLELLRSELAEVRAMVDHR